VVIGESFGYLFFYIQKEISFQNLKNFRVGKVLMSSQNLCNFFTKVKNCFISPVCRDFSSNAIAFLHDKLFEQLKSLKDL